MSDYGWCCRCCGCSVGSNDCGRHGAFLQYRGEDDGTIIVAESPNPHGEWTWERASARRMEQLIGRRVTWYNLFEVEPERWSAMRARAAASGLLAELTHDHTVLMLGRRVCAAFGHQKLPWLHGSLSKHALLVAVPHPSGLNRWWNDPANVELAETTLRGI